MTLSDIARKNRKVKAQARKGPLLRWNLFIYSLLSVMIFASSDPAIAKPPAPKPPAATPPIRIVAPESGTKISAGEQIEIQILVGSGVRASAVQITYDGKGIALLNKAPFTATWDTTGLKGGSYVIQASAFLDTGVKLSAVPIEVFIEAQAVVAPQTGAMITEGTPILLATEEFLKSGETKTGTAIRFKTERDVLGQDGRILIPYGAHAIGEVLQSKNHGLFGKAGKLDFALRSVTAADGTEVPIRAVRNESADGKTGTVIVGALLLSPLILLFNGPNVEIPAGTVITAYVDRNTPITSTLASRFDPALNVERSAVIISPSAGQIIKKEKKVSLECAITPPDDNAYVRMYLDGQMILNQKATAGVVEWQGSKQFEDGTHTLEAEVTFSSGHVVKAAPVEFILGRLRR